VKLCNDKLIVVTGGAGFIGSCLVRQLNEQGYNNLVIVDNLGSTEKWKNLVGKRFYDCIHKNDLFSWLQGREVDIEAFIHLGACSNTLECDASYLLENNYRYSVKLCEYALRSGHRFIYASSASTYGNGEQGFSDDHEALDELRPLNMYGYSKHLFDLWAKQQGILSQVVGLKYFNVFGPNEYHKGRMASAIVRMLPEAMQEDTIRLFKSDQTNFVHGEQKRDFIYVKDAVRLTLSFLSNALSGIFNIGSGEATSWNRLATAVFKAVHKPCNIEYIAMPNDLKGKYQYFTQANIQKTKKGLGAHFSLTSVENAVQEYVQDYLLVGQRW
jgi:ADP-L-glycero-D-manno-heptose 6-epimerase